MNDEEIQVESLDEEALWRLVTALGSAITPFEVAEAVTMEGAPAVGGTFANVALLMDGSDSVQVIHRSPFNPALVTMRGTYDLSAATPACEAIRTGLPVLLGSLIEVESRFPLLVPEIAEAGLSARASLPLHSASGITLGAVGIGWPGPQRFTSVQLRRLDLVAQLVGLALERATEGHAEPDSGEQLPRVLETMPNAFFSLDGGLIITSINTEAERLLRKPRAELLGRHFFDPFPEGVRSELEFRYQRAMASGRSVVFEEYFAPFEGWFEVHAWPDRDGLNVYFTDVSDRRNSEFEQSIALVEAQQAHERLSFLANLSTMLHGAVTRTEVYQRISRAVIGSMADWSTVTVPSGDELIRVAAAHCDPILDGLAKRLVGGYPHSFAGPSPGVVVYRSGEPLRLSQLAEEIVTDLDDSVASAAYGRTLRLLGNGPGLIVPILTKESVVAVLTMARRDGEPFSDADVDTMTQAATRVSELLDDALHLETQRETASALQAAALPRYLPNSKSLTLAAGYRPASQGAEVGGDWYDAFELQSGHIALVVGDAAGHGLHAAALMTQMRNALRAHLFDSMGPSESLSKLSSLIATQAPDALATIICVDVDPVSGRVVWASAGHPAPILLNREGTSVYLQGKPAPPIGSSDARSPAHPTEHPLELGSGDRLLMFTDGLFERRGVDLEIGLTHLMITTEQTRGANDTEIACEAILAEMLRGTHDDDVCLLIADFNPVPLSSAAEADEESQ